MNLTGHIYLDGPTIERHIQEEIQKARVEERLYIARLVREALSYQRGVESGPAALSALRILADGLELPFSGKKIS